MIRDFRFILRILRYRRSVQRIVNDRKVGSLELPTCIETNRRINYARCNCFLFTAGRIGHANGGDWHAVRDSRANGNELFLCRERVGP